MLLFCLPAIGMDALAKLFEQKKSLREAGLTMLGKTPKQSLRKDG